MKSTSALITLFVVPSGFGFEDNHGHIRGNVHLSRFNTFTIPIRDSVSADYYTETKAEKSPSQSDSRRQLVQQSHIRRAMSYDKLEASEEHHNLFLGSTSMLFNLHGTNVTPAKSSKSAKDPEAGEETPPKVPKDPKSGKETPKSEEENPKPISSKKAKSAKNQICPMSCEEGFVCNPTSGLCVEEGLVLSAVTSEYIENNAKAEESRIQLESTWTYKKEYNESNLPVPAHECTINMIALNQIPGEPLIKGGDIEYGCDDGSGLFSPLHLDKLQQKSLQGLAASGQVLYGKSKININGATFNQDGSITTPPGKPISAKARVNNEKVFLRRPRTTKASKRSVLLFRVTDVNGLVHEDNPDLMSDKVFGTKGDEINLKTQLAACSAGQYSIIPGTRPGFDISDLQSALGVIDIKLDISLDNNRAAVRNAAISKAQEVMAHKFNLPNTTILTTYTDHTLFSLENCYQECGWAAYASIGSYYQFYQGSYYSYAALQMHEHGHNMYLAHSGGLDGGAYSDHTCSMGNPLYGDDFGKMCFNPAKLWQLHHNPHPVTVKYGWYDPLDFFTVDTSSGPQVYEMIGIGEYRLQQETSRKVVALRIIVPGGIDKYIGFNSAKGANFQNDLASDMVTIVEWNTTSGYIPSSLKGYIAQGETFLLENGITVTAKTINTMVSPPVACVCVKESHQTCPSDCGRLSPNHSG